MTEKVEFYDRRLEQIPLEIVAEIVSRDVARQGYRVDRLAPITVSRHGRTYWRYDVPVIRVVH